ncbi:ATP-binding protein [Maridesulfovibrio sp.]|uniref:hybrid sensor histidine kinase/response regulator n=1 Tax=Maridesulfovibrio sp. TaxID=2795000 RepID=UPI0029CA45FA|nr:ATP-binding protein [Maridesulfovibrio sp.]
MFVPVAALADSPQTIILNGSRGSYDLRDYVTVLKDEGFTINQVASDAFTGKFSKPGSDFYPGLSKHGYWLHFKVKADPAQVDQIWRVAITPPQTKQFTVFYPEIVKGMKSGWGRWDAGYENPRRTSWKGEDFLAFRLPLHEKVTDYYVYYCAEDTNYNIFELVDENSFRENSRLQLLFLSVVGGFSVALVLYNFFLFISLRDISHLWYSLQCLSINIYYFIVVDAVIEFIDIPMEYYIVLNYSFLGLFMFLSSFFVESFLANIRGKLYAKIIFIILKSVSLISIVLAFFLGVNVMTLISAGMMMVYSITFIVLGVRSYCDGFTAARLYLVSWSLFCLGLMFASFCAITGLVNLDYLVFTMQITNMIEMLFFSLALADRISVLRRDRQVAEALSQAKSSFLATMSHEIRTPLNAIVGMSRVILQSDLTPDQRRKMSVVRNSSDLLQHIINDILDFSRIEAGKMEIECLDFDLREIVNSVADVVRIDSAAKGIEFDLDMDSRLPRAVKGDPVRLRQVLLNLLSNAVKFTESGSVGLKIQPLDHDFVRFTVSDTGIGIPKELQENIFDKFAQADDSMTRRFGGTGLGLSICRQLVEMMGGSIHLRSSTGSGTSISCVLPLEPGELAKVVRVDHPLKAMAVSAKPLKLLVAEDNMNNIELMRAVLEQTPYHVSYVHDGLSALEAVRTGNFDMVLMDLEMPNMNGLETVRAIREGEAGEDKTQIPVVALTAHVLDEIRVECEQAGMNGFISKPFNVDDLLMVIAASVHSTTFIDSARKAGNISETLPVFDESGFRAMFGYDDDVCSRVITSFLDELPLQLVSMEESIALGDYDKLAGDAHFLKTSAGVISAGRFLLYTGELELAARNADGEVDSAFAKVRKAAEELQRTLSTTLTI